MKLLTHDKPFFPNEWEKKFIYLRDMGFDGFEIDGGVLLKEFDRIKKASEVHNFPVRMICGGYNGWIGDFDPDRRKQGISDINQILKAGYALNVQGIVLPAAWGMFSKRLPPMIPPRTQEEDTEVLLDSLAKLNAIAKETNTTIYLEPLNRYEDYMLNHIYEAAALIELGSFDSVKICYDFFHMNIEESKMDDPILEFHQHIGHVHLASSHRYQPGSGHLDYQPGFRALREIDYDGDFAFECRVLGDDPEVAYRKSVDFVRNELKKAGY
ncbi:MAG: sugar phosphate isomerase/epimerase [Bacilli bacterium]|nr:sugar phosphate isomerase/epimerase [Bacilli bacterium]MBN2696398.1 sugar phosphate isomerase/epimerase [Bacilli bacterium]